MFQIETSLYSHDETIKQRQFYINRNVINK